MSVPARSLGCVEYDVLPSNLVPLTNTVTQLFLFSKNIQIKEQ